MIAPPRLAVRWLEHRLHPDERADILGDLIEQFHRRAAGNPRAARRWFWRQTLALVWGFAIRRRDVVSTTHERTRGIWLLRNAGSDWRYALRSLVAGRGATVAAFLVLALGLGLSTTVFSVINSLLLRPLDFANADRLVRLAEARPPRGPASGAPVLNPSGGEMSDVAIGQFIQTARQLDAVSPYGTTGRNVTTAAGTEQRSIAEVGTRFFDLTGITPLEGRLFQDADGRRDAPEVVAIGERFWRDELGGRRDAIGQTLTIDQKPYAIVGVVPAGFRFPEPGIEIWIAGRWTWPQPGVRRSFMMWTETFARLAPDATTESAAAEARTIAGRMAAADPAFLDGIDVPVPIFRVRRLQDDLVAPVKPALVALGAGMALVLLAAAANLLNLLLARSTARHREMAVRLTLGAGRWRVVRPLLFEQMLLAGSGAIAGGLLAWWLLRSLPAFAPAALSRLADVRLDGASLAFASMVALALALIVGLLPALQLPRANLRTLSAGGAIGRSGMPAGSFRRVLVAAQVALAVTLLVGAALLGRTLWSLSRVHPGYRGGGALTFQIGVPDGLFREPARQSAFFDDLLARLTAHPGVVAAGAASTLPLNNVGLSGSFAIEGRPKPTTPEEWPRADKIGITPGYLDALGTRLLRGRGLSLADSAAAEPVVLINEAVARQYFPGEEPLGQRIDFLRKLFRIVGVVEGIRQKSVTTPANAALYFAAAQVPPVLAFNRLTGGVALRCEHDPNDLVPFIRSTMKAIDPDWPIHNVMRLDDRLDTTFAGPRFYSIALGLFAALALATAVFGVYGVLSYTVERRQAEFGVRRALGGGEAHIIGLVVRQAAGLVVAGLIIGLGLAAAGAEVLRSLLFGVEPIDAATFITAAVFVAAIGCAAAIVPAWRALRVDPVRALRAE